MNKEELIYSLWLYSIKGIGPKKFRLIKSKYNSLKEAYLNRNELEAEGIFDHLRDEIKNSDTSKAEKILEFCEKNNINIILEEDSLYPDEFRIFDYAPVVLFAKGDARLLRSAYKISMVGTREPTYYGKKVAKELSGILASLGFIVVSGMARGIDSFCHAGALESGKTIAVLGCGVDIVYPKENLKLYRQIMENGCIISEFLPGTLPDKMNFPQRNRIVAMLSPCLVVIEASTKSGTFSTVDFALEQGKEVFAVPGSIFSQKSSGTNRLIKEGARIICSYEDFLEDVKEIYALRPFQLSFETDQNEDELTDDEKTLLRLLEQNGELHIENLIMLTGWSPNKVASIVTSLEIKSKVVRHHGNIISKL